MSFHDVLTALTDYAWLAHRLGSAYYLVKAGLLAWLVLPQTKVLPAGRRTVILRILRISAALRVGLLFSTHSWLRPSLCPLKLLKTSLHLCMPMVALDPGL